jgi:hypothetical protein
MDKNISKKDLLKLKDSKPIPITAHSFEIVIPVCYTSKVKKFLDKEGIKLPLSKEKLAKLRKIAKNTKGELSESDEENDEESYAKGTTNLKQTINIKIDTRSKSKKKRKGRKKKYLKTTSGLVEAPKQESLLKQIKNPDINVLRPNNFSLIRPITYSASTPVTDYKKILDENLEKEKALIKKREDELKEEVQEKNRRIDRLTQSYEEEKRRNEALIRNDFLLPPPRPKKKDYDTDEEREQYSSDEDEKDAVDAKKEIINDIKEFRKLNLSLEDLKREVLELMETYKQGSVNYGLTSVERAKIMNQTSHQGVYQEFRSFGQQLMDWVED